MDRIDYLKGRRTKPRPSRFDNVSWEDFEDVCKDYDSDILELKEEIKGLKKTIATLVKLSFIQRDYNDTIAVFLENKYVDDFEPHKPLD